MENDLKPIVLYDGREVNHGDVVNVAIDRLIPNMYNPNVLSEEDFRMLMDNTDKVGFIDPVVATPSPDDPTVLLTIDGHHRIEERKISGATEIPCVIVSNEIFDEKTVLLQTVRLNKIRGSLNTEKFNALVKHLVSDHDVPFEDMAEELGFSDEDEFDALVAKGREQLPPAARKEYDKAVKNVDKNDIHRLSKIIERIWLRYSNTLPSNFMVLDFSNKRHLWVTLKAAAMGPITDIFRECMAAGFTIDSLLESVLLEVPVSELLEKHVDKLRRIEEEEGAQQTLEDLLEP